MPPSIDEPTLGEVLRRISDLSSQVAALVAEIKQDRIDAAKTFVRQDVYIVEQNMQNAVVSDLNGDIKTMREDLKAEKASRRQIWLAISAIAVSLLSIFVTIIIAIVR